MIVVQVKLSENNRDWFITVNGQLIRRFSNKQEAIDLAGELAQDYGAELIIHGKDGQVYRHSATIGSKKEEKIREAIRGINKAPRSAEYSIKSEKAGWAVSHGMHPTNSVTFPHSGSGRRQNSKVSVQKRDRS
jgi:Uncharacterized protein conserved in bacteria (DUF2188)